MALRTMMKFKLVFCFIVVLAISSFAGAIPISVGTGVNTAGVYLEWKDGYMAEFEVNFGSVPTDTVTGADLLLTLDSELVDFTFLYSDFGTPEVPNFFVDSIEYLGHFDGGFGGGEDWWHYWNQDLGEPSWTSSMVGMSARTVSDGDMDGWIYGRAGAVPEPATLLLLGLGGLMLRRKS